MSSNSKLSPKRTEHQYSNSDVLFMLGEELKKPLTVIKALAETNASSDIQMEARRALRTIDNVLLYQQLSSSQISLDLEPVHVGSTLTQVAANLEPLSLLRGCETEVYIQSGITTVDADANVLKSGIESLWQAMLAMAQRPSPLNWYVYRSKKGIRIAITNNSVDLSKVKFNSNNFGKSRQPFAGLSGPATDLITASGMFDLLGSKVTKTHRQNTNGFAVTLPISPQLALV